jgi:autotransporter passenger strand-loop-strand repeat protein
VLSSGGYLLVFSGGNVAGTVSSGGQVVSTGVLADTPNSGAVYGATSLTGAVISSGGTEYVLAGGTASAAVISSGGQDQVVSGGRTVGETVRDAGIQFISSGGMASATHDSGSQYVSSGGAASGTTVFAGGLQYVLFGGVASGTTVSSGGTLQIGDAYGPGSATNVVVDGGGYLFAYDSLLSSVVVGSGGVAQLESGSASGTTVKGGAVFEALGVVSGGVISSGGIEVLSGNAYYGKGEAAGVTVDQGGILAVLPGASASGTLGAGQVVSTGVVAFGNGGAPFAGKSGGPATLSAGAMEDVLSGGVVSNVVLNAAGGSGYGGTQVMYAGGTANGTKVYGRQLVSGGSVYAAVVASGGEQDVFSGTVSGTQVANGGTEFVTGTASGSTVSAGGVIQNAGNLVSPVIAGGILEDEIGTITGTINFTGSGGTLTFYAPSPPTNTISGFAAGDEIILKGLTYVSGATAAVATAGVVTINNGGQLYKLHIAGTTVGEAGFAFGPGGVLTFSGGAAAAEQLLAWPFQAASYTKPHSSVAAVTDASGRGLAPTARANGYKHGIAMAYDQIQPAAVDHTALLANWFQ